MPASLPVLAFTSRIWDPQIRARLPAPGRRVSDAPDARRSTSPMQVRGYNPERER